MGEAGSISATPGVEDAPSFKAKLSAAMELGKPGPSATRAQAGADATALSFKGEPSDPSQATGKDLPRDGNPSPQSLTEAAPETNPAHATFLAGFSEPSNVPVPAHLGERFAKGFQESESKKVKESISAVSEAHASELPPTGSAQSNQHGGVGEKKGLEGLRSLTLPEVPINSATTPSGRVPGLEQRPDPSSSSDLSDPRHEESSLAARSDTFRVTAFAVPPVAKSLSSSDLRTRNPNASSANAVPEGPIPQSPRATPTFELSLRSDLSEDMSAAPKPSTASLASSLISASGGPGAPIAALAAAAPGPTPAPLSPNAPAVVGTPSAAPPASVESYVEHIVDAREASRLIRPEFTLRHGDFGQVGLRIDPGSSANINEWRATLVARDPGFVPTVQAALGERISAASESGLSHNGAFSQRGNETGSQSSGSNPSGHSGSQSPTANTGQDQRYGSSTGDDQGSAKPYSGEEALNGSNTAAADSLETDTSDALDRASGKPGALFA
ncbi:MAG: hypothetical protein AAF251_06980 [Pseudomonadota bacterium]